jgi:hypothetical protein
MVRRRGQFAGPWVSSHTDACIHVGVGGRWDRFSTIEKRRREYAGCRAQSARVPESNARRCGQVAGPWVSGHTDACAHFDAGGRWTDFRPSINGGGSVRAAAHSLRECGGAMAQWRGQVAGPQDFGPLGRCTHIGAGVRRDRFSTIDKRGRRCLREPAHGLGEWPKAISRRGRLVAGSQDFGPLGRCIPYWRMLDEETHDDAEQAEHESRVRLQWRC